MVQGLSLQLEHAHFYVAKPELYPAPVTQEACHVVFATKHVHKHMLCKQAAEVWEGMRVGLGAWSFFIFEN